MNMMIEWLAGNCKQHLLDEKWLIADDLRTSQQWKDQLNLAGHPSINLHSKTLRSLAVALVGEVLASQELSFASQATARMIVHSIVSKMLKKSELEYFNTVNSIDGLCDLLAKSIRDLRLAEVEPNAMAEKDFESAAKARDVIRFYQAYCERLQVDHAADYATCIHLAIKGIQDGTIKLPSGLMVLVPEELNRLTKAEQGLFEAITKAATIERPTFEGFNEEAANALLKFCKVIPSKVNLIEYNPIDDGEFKQASDEVLHMYMDLLERNGITTRIRKSRGKDIDAACGQLANKS